MVVDGRIRGGTGMMVEGVFVKQVIPDSPADLDGRYIMCNMHGAHMVSEHIRYLPWIPLDLIITLPH